MGRRAVAPVSLRRSARDERRPADHHGDHRDEHAAGLLLLEGTFASAQLFDRDGPARRWWRWPNS
jgi:hypothetical protein